MQPAIVDFWKTYSGLIGNDINQKHGYSSAFLKLFKANRKQWLEESGFVLKHVQYKRAGITADDQAEWTDADNAAFPEAIQANNSTNYDGSSGGGGAYDNRNNVDPPTDVIKFNYDERGYGLVQKAFNTQDFSLESLRAAAKSAAQMDAVTKALADLSREYLIRLHRDEFARVANNRFVATGTSSSPTFLENSSSDLSCYDATTASRWTKLGFGNGTYVTNSDTIDTPDKQNTSILTWGHLEELYLRLVEDGGENYTDIFSDGQPVFMLLTDLKTKRRLITEGTTNGRDIRTDIRESSMADELLKPMGVTSALNGWVLMTDVAPRRFAIEGDSGDSSGATGTGVWAEKLIYSNDASNLSRSINADYRTASFVESYVLAPKAFSCFAPRPGYTGKGAASFRPQNYTGEYAFRVIDHKVDNPDGAHGFFRGKIANATVAEDPDLLYVIRHREGSGTGV